MIVQDPSFGASPIQILMPGDLLGMITALDADYERVNADITSQASTDFADAWIRQYSAWKDFVASHESWTSRIFATGVGDLIDSFRSALVDWQSKFQAQGGAVTGPAVAAPDAPSLSGLTSWIPWAVAGLALVYLGPSLGRMLSGSRRAEA